MLANGPTGVGLAVGAAAPTVPPERTRSSREPSYVIISGGTGANSFATAFGARPAFVLPVSDDGGSSAEILRCFGGPSIGDIRSRLIRLIPLRDSPTTMEDKERAAIYNLMAHRFPADAAEKVVRDLWGEIVEGRGSLWDGIGEDKKECIRAFLVHFQTLCLRRAHKRFAFRNLAIGNAFLTGAREMFNSLASAIFLFKAVAGVSEGVQVIPVINTNQTVTIAAQLANTSTLVGQCNISHPTPPPTPAVAPARHPFAFPPPAPKMTGASHLRRDSRTFDTIDTPVSPSEWSRASFEIEPISDLDETAGGNLVYTKGMEEFPLEARIERLFYINLYGQEIFPEPNPDYLGALTSRDVLVYSCGSLWTSIIPCLALRRLAAAIGTSPSLKAKVLLLNATNDRETPDFRGIDYIDTITAMLQHYDAAARPVKPGVAPAPRWTARHFFTHVVHLEGAPVDVQADAIHALGVKTLCVPRTVHGATGAPLFSTETVEWALARVLEDC